MQFNRVKSGNCQWQMLWQALLPALALATRRFSALKISHIRFSRSARTLTNTEPPKKKHLQKHRTFQLKYRTRLLKPLSLSAPRRAFQSPGGWQVFGDCKPHTSLPGWTGNSASSFPQMHSHAKAASSPLFHALPSKHFVFSTDHPPPGSLLMAGFSSISPLKTHRHPTRPAHHHPCVQDCRQPLSHSSSFKRAAHSTELGSKNTIIESVFRKSRLPKQEQ